MKLYLAILLIITFSLYSLPPLRKSKPADVKAILEKTYEQKNGFLITPEEGQKITDQGGAPTYGEIIYESLKELLDYVNSGEKDVFYDLGSGVGKVCMQAILTTPIKKCVGIELSPTRVEHAQKAQKELQKNKELSKEQRKRIANNLEFKAGDICKADLSDATIIFMCSTCFSDELMQKLLTKFITINHDLTIITLRRLPEHPQFKLVKEFTLTMTWSTSSPVYVYRKKVKP